MVPNVEVYSENPGAAAAAGCTASYSVASSSSQHSASQQEEYDVTYYQLHATEAGGWKFVRFEWTRAINSSGSYESLYPSGSYDHSTGGSLISGEYIYPRRGVNANLADADRLLHDVPDNWMEYHDYRHGAIIGTSHQEVVYCRAVFVQDSPPTPTYGDITVETSADPVAGGTTSPVSETHHYAGNPSTTFTLTATPNVGYVFEKWLHNGTEYSLNAQTTVTLYFSSSAQTKHYVAKFRISDKILHGANGTILHGSGGTILSGG